MKARPILFSGAMVRGLLAGTKTQTRRLVKGVPLDWLDDSGFTPAFVADPGNSLCPYGAPGDVLWARETWGMNHYEFEQGPIPKARPADLTDEYLTHLATESDTEIVNGLRWWPSIHMPRWANRLTLAVTEVRIERLQDINEADALAEGIEHVTTTSSGRFYRNFQNPGCPVMAYGAYRSLWNHINGPSSWDTNPWVWAVSFEVHEQNVDAFLSARAA